MPPEAMSSVYICSNQFCVCVRMCVFHGCTLLPNFGLRAGDLNFPWVVRSPAEDAGDLNFPLGCQVSSTGSRYERSVGTIIATVFDSPLSAIVDVSVTSIMRSSVVESRVDAEYSVARRHSETVEAIVGTLQGLLRPSDP
jgi:hypothetical protein